jgi:hypothetical protein
MPRLRVHYACDKCGHASSAKYFDYRYHETEAVQAPCGGCSYMTRHAPQSAERITDEDRSTKQPPDQAAQRARPQTWRQFQQRGFTRWECSHCGNIEQSLELPDPCDCAD